MGKPRQFDLQIHLKMSKHYDYNALTNKQDIAYDIQVQGDTATLASFGYQLFDTTTNYSVDDVVIYNDNLYRFASAHTAGAWNGNDVTPTTIDEEIERKKFRTGENLKETGIIDGIANNAATDVLSAKQGMEMGQKLRDIDLTETLVDKVMSGAGQNVYPGYINGSTGAYTSSSYNYYVIVPVTGYRRVRWLGKERANNSSHLGWGFGTFSGAIDATLSTFTPITKGEYANNPGDNNAVEYIQSVPEGATHAVITIWVYMAGGVSAVTLDNFYCYKETGDTVTEAIKFKGGEIVKDTSIKDTVVDNLATDVLSARQGMETDHKLGDVTFREVRAELFGSGVNKNVFIGKVFCSTASSPYISGRTSNNNYAIINVEGVKRLRFLGATLESGSYQGGAITMPGWAFYDESNHSTSGTNDGGYLIDRTGAISWGCFDITGEKTTKEYIVDVPDGAKYVKLCRTYYDGSLIFGASTFYCYKQYGSTVSEDMDAKVSGSDMQGQWKWKKNLINIKDLVNANMFGSPLALGFDSNNPNCLMAKIHLEDGMQYTASNVSIVKSGSNYYFQIFRFASDGTYINQTSYNAEETSTNHTTYNSTGKSTFIYKKSNVSGKEESYQLIRLRFAQIPNSATWQDWKNAQVEIGDKVTALAPYHSERLFSEVGIPSTLETVNLEKKCGPIALNNLSEGANIEEGNIGSSNKFGLLKWDVGGVKQVNVVGKIGSDYYTFPIYTWADEDGNKLFTDQAVIATISIHQWDAVLNVPEGAKYLYAAAYRPYLSTYVTNKIEPFSTDVFINYINDYVKNNSYQKVINILAIGNSYSQDSLAYVPFLAQRYGLTVNIAILMKSSSTIKNAYDYFKSNSKQYLYQYCYDNDYRWHWNSSTLYSIQDVLDKRQWDIIFVNISAGMAVEPSEDSYGLSSIQRLNELYCRIADYVDYPVKFAGLMPYQHVSVVNTHTSPDMPDDWDSNHYYQLQDMAWYIDGNNKETEGIYESLWWDNKNHPPYGVNEYYWAVATSGTGAAWDADTQYAVDDIVTYEGTLYKCKVAGKNHPPYGVNENYWKRFYPAYSATATYSKGAIVRDPDNGSIMYVSKVDNNTGHSLGDGDYWRSYEWDDTEAYAIGDMVLYDEVVWYCKAANTGQEPVGGDEDNYWLRYNRPYTEEQLEENYDSQITSCERYLANTLGEFIVPINTAIQNAYTVETIRSLGEYIDTISNTTGYGWLTAGDGYHLNEGLPCQLAAYVVLLSIFNIMGMEQYGIMGDDTMADKAWLADKYIPGRQGMSCGYTDDDKYDNLKFIQRCAVMAMKTPYTVTDMNKYYPLYNTVISSNTSFSNASNLAKAAAATALGITEAELDKLMKGRYGTMVYDSDESLFVDSAGESGGTVTVKMSNNDHNLQVELANDQYNIIYS